MDNFASFIEMLESIVTIVAIIIGGLWTYLLYVRQRIHLPRIKPSIMNSIVEVSNGWIVHIEVQLENVGTVVLQTDSANLRLRQVIPLPNEIAHAIDSKFDPVDDQETEIVYPVLAQRYWNSQFRQIEIEPGEYDCLHADFFVPEEVRVIQVYLYVANKKKRRRDIGWSSTKIICLPARARS